jgi:DMSO/TMAO reductase YedYZ molybdopterin-dependent catalytic subunit
MRRGLVAGAVAGLALIGGMEVAGVAGLRSLPDVLQQPVLAVMPGPVFGFLIDTLQHAGKVLEEIGLLIAMLVVLAGAGAAAAAARARGLPQVGLIAGGVVWAIICLGLLPLGGSGFLGLHDGWGTPLAWAVLCALYGVLLDEGLRERTDAYDPSRRRLLSSLPGWVGLAGLVALGVIRLPGWVQITTAPPEKSSGGEAPALTPVGNFYQVSKNFQDPVVDARTWSLQVGGLAGAPYQLSLDQLRQITTTTMTVTLECISNTVGGPLMSTGRFTGIPLGDLVRRAQPQPGAGAIEFVAHDGYTESLPLQMAMNDPDIIVAHMLDGQPLPNAHGFPARIVFPGHYGMRGPKWLERITLTRDEQGGYWEGQGWDHQAVVKTTSRIDVPTGGDVLRRGAPAQIAGVAFAGVRGISKVEWSHDGGQSWSSAELEKPLSPLTWTRWFATWTPARAGAYQLVVRARDGGGALQDRNEAPSFPNGASGWDQVEITVGS